MSNYCPEPSDENPTNNFGEEAANIAASVGMNETCKKAARTSGAFFSASVDAKAPFVGASAQTSGGVFDNTMQQSGCGQSFVNFSKIFQNQEAITCNIVKNNTASSTQSQNFQTILIETLGPTRAETEAYYKITSQVFNDNSLTILASQLPVGEASTKLIEKLANNKAAMLKIVSDNYNRDVNVTETRITQSITSDIKLSVSLKSEVSQIIAAQQNAIAAATARQNLTTELGLNAMDPNVKSMVSQQQTTDNKFTSQTVDETVQKVTATFINQQQLSIKASGRVTLENVNIDQNICSTLVAQVLFNNATSTGVTMAQSALNKAASDVVSKSKSAGVDALVDAMGKANANAIKANKQGGIMGGIFIAIIIGIIMLFMFGKGIVSNIVKYISPILLITGIVFIVIFAKNKNKIGLILSVIGTSLLSFLQVFILVSSKNPKELVSSKNPKD